MKLHTEAEYMAATAFTLHQTIDFRSGLGPYMGQVAESDGIAIDPGAIELPLLAK